MTVGVPGMAVAQRQSSKKERERKYHPSKKLEMLIISILPYEIVLKLM